MQRIELQGVIVATGQYGPFADRGGAIIPWADVSDGQDVFRVLLPDGVPPSALPPALERVTLPIDVTARDGKPRFHFAADIAGQRKAA